MLPIALKSFHIKNYRGIIDTQIDNIPPGTQWIFLTGENGFGKTSVLQGITSLIVNPTNREYDDTASGQLLILKNGTILEIPNIFKYNAFMREDGTLYGRDNKPVTINVDFSLHYEIVAYGSTRLRVSAASTKEVIEKYSFLDSLFSNEALLIDIEEKFKDWHTNYLKGFERLENLFKELIPRLGKVSVEFDEKEKRTNVKYYETDSKGVFLDNGVTFIQLATGYKNIIAMIGDLISRLSIYQKVEDFQDLQGIVLIDEIDLHLHPKYQKLFVEKLTELFPKIQFIVSTHSPIPLLGAPKNSVIINVSRTREEGIKAELLDIDFSVLTPNSILSSPIFGFQDLIPESKSDDKMIRTEDTFQEVEFNDQLKKNINEFLTKERQEELLKLIKTKQV